MQRSKSIAQVLGSSRSQVGIGVHHRLSAAFGGITSAVHGISFRGVDISIFTPSAQLPRTLRHVLSDITPDATQEISAPTPLPGPQPRAPIYIDGMMRREDSSISASLRRRLLALVCSNPLGGAVVAYRPRNSCKHSTSHLLTLRYFSRTVGLGRCCNVLLPHSW